MGRSFGRRIEQFVMSNDIMEEAIFRELMRLIAQYLEKDLHIAHFALLVEGRVDDKSGLETGWSIGDVKPSYTLPDDPESEFKSYSAYAFVKQTPIWLVREAGDSDGAADTWKDLWSGNTDMPAELELGGGFRTAVRYPVRRAGQVIGILELASRKHVEPTPVSRDELSKLSRVIERAYRKKEIREMQRENSRTVIEQLGSALDNETWTRLALPKMFIAFPGGSYLEEEAQQGHKAVLDTIREVVGAFDGQLAPVFWDEIEESGNITQQVIREIGLAEYGICYFSEPALADGSTPEDGNTYRDNPNVLYEAGMMQALQNSAGALLKGWIPIREAASPQLPFDIAAERIIIIAREEEDPLMKLRQELTARLENLVRG